LSRLTPEANGKASQPGHGTAPIGESVGVERRHPIQRRAVRDAQVVKRMAPSGRSSKNAELGHWKRVGRRKVRGSRQGIASGRFFTKLRDFWGWGKNTKTIPRDIEDRIKEVLRVEDPAKNGKGPSDGSTKRGSSARFTNYLC